MILAEANVGSTEASFNILDVMLAEARMSQTPVQDAL